jgi:uncharacterized RDD family membrane protein YckC
MSIKRDNKPLSQSSNHVLPPPSIFRIFGAILYDIIALGAIWFFAALIVLVFRQGETVASGSIVFSLYLGVVAYAYFGFCWTRSGQTLGMKCWRIRLVDSKTDRAIGWASAATRCAAAMVSLGVLGLGFFWAIFDHNSRTWHDRLSGSHLLREPAP